MIRRLTALEAPMTAHLELIREVETVIANSAADQRVEMLRKVTDLFIAGSSLFSDRDVSIFDDVIKRLAGKIEQSARELLATRLAPLPNAPPGTIRLLACDNAIEVAGPVLTQSPRLDDATLVESARKRGLSHMLAISQRSFLSEAVTDVLVEFGDRNVVMRTVENRGARFSDLGFSMLVDRSDGDEGMAACVGSRPEIPTQLLRTLIAKASEAVRAKLEAAHPYAREEVRTAIAEVVSRIATQPPTAPSGDAAGRAHVEQLQQSGALDESALAAFARAGAFVETTAALAALCEVPFKLVDQAMAQDRSETLLILAKAIGISWPTVKEMLLLRAKKGIIASNDIVHCLASFERLKSRTAQEIVRFYRTRAQAKSVRPG